MELADIMPKLQYKSNTVHYESKVLILAYCGKNKRSSKQILEMFKQIEIELSPSQLLYIIHNLIKAGYLNKRPNPADVRTFLYWTGES